MINVAISYGFGNENRYNVGFVPESVQLALYKYDLYLKYRDELFQQLHENKTQVRVIHLPIDSLRRDPEDTYEIMKTGLKEFGCTHYVIHPNKMIRNFIHHFLSSGLNVKLCIENFQWRSNKRLRTPLDIIERILEENEYEGRQNLGMTFDTTHADEVWFDHRVLPFILRYTNVIHLSNRAKGVGDHIPCNDPRGKLNLVQFVNDLKRRYHWRGTIVLEYMEDYRDKVFKNYEYLKRLVA